MYSIGKRPLPLASGGPGARLTMRETVEAVLEFHASVRVPSGRLLDLDVKPRRVR